MFNLLVESTRQSRRRTPKYFLLTLLAYGSIIGAAVVGSIMFYKPALADTYDTIAMIAPLPPPAADGGPAHPQPAVKRPVEKIISDSVPLTNNTVISDKVPPQVNVPSNGDFGLGDGRGTGSGTGPGGPGVPGGITVANVTPPPLPDLPPAPERKSDPPKPDRVYKISDGVTLGKAINIPRPVYPTIAKTIHLEGEVRVELVVDKTGRVMSAVAVSGPQMLRPAAVDAALRSTFKPTLLSGEPVIVQALFTFNFKLN